MPRVGVLLPAAVAVLQRAVRFIDSPPRRAKNRTTRVLTTLCRLALDKIGINLYLTKKFPTKMLPRMMWRRAPASSAPWPYAPNVVAFAAYLKQRRPIQPLRPCIFRICFEFGSVARDEFSTTVEPRSVARRAINAAWSHTG